MKSRKFTRRRYKKGGANETISTNTTSNTDISTNVISQEPESTESTNTEEVPPQLTEEEQKSQDKELYIFSTKQISTNSNVDKDYLEKGIIHLTDSIEVKTNGEGITGMFTKKEFDDSLIDKARNDLLYKISNMLETNQKVCNLRMDIFSQGSLFFMNIYGTLFEKEEKEEEKDITEDNEMIE